MSKKREQAVQLALIAIVVAVALVAVICIVDYPPQSIVGNAIVPSGPYSCSPLDSPARDQVDSMTVTSGDGSILGTLSDKCHDGNQFSSEGRLLVEWHCVSESVGTFPEIPERLATYRLTGCDCINGMCVASEYCTDDDHDTYWAGPNCDEYGIVEERLDCDDTNVEVYPGAEEVCNQVDDDCNGEIDEGCGPHDQPGLEWCDGSDNDGDGLVDENQVGDAGFCNRSALRPLNSVNTIFTEEELKREFIQRMNSGDANDYVSLAYLLREAAKHPSDYCPNPNTQYNTHAGGYAIVTMYEVTGDPVFLDAAKELADTLIDTAVPIPGGPPGWDASGCLGRTWRAIKNEMQGLRTISRLARVMKEKGHNDSEWMPYYRFAADIIDHYNEGPGRLEPTYDKLTHYSQNAIDLYAISGEEKYKTLVQNQIPTLFQDTISFVIEDGDFYNAYWDQYWKNEPPLQSDTSHANRFAEYMVQMYEDDIDPRIGEEDIVKMVNTFLFRIWSSDPNVITNDHYGNPQNPYPTLFHNEVSGGNECVPWTDDTWSPYAVGQVGYGWNFLGRHDDRARWVTDQMTRAVIDNAIMRGFAGGEGCTPFRTNQNKNHVNSFIAESLRQMKLASGEI